MGQIGKIVPEVIIYNLLNSILKLVKDDFAKESEEDTILYDFFAKGENNQDLAFENFNFLYQAKEIFIEKTPSINIGYNLEVAAMPSVHILLPSENGNNLMIGADEGYQDFKQKSDGTSFKKIFTQSFESVYNLLITSENSMQVIMLYNFLKYCLISLNAELELAGLRLPKLSGQDLNMQSNLIPTHIYHRSLLFSFLYEINVESLFYEKFIKNFKVTGIICNSVNIK